MIILAVRYLRYRFSYRGVEELARVHSPRCSAAQNVCTISGIIRSENAVNAHLSLLATSEDHSVVHGEHSPRHSPGSHSHRLLVEPPGRTSSLRCGRSTRTLSSTPATDSQDRGMVTSAVSLAQAHVATTARKQGSPYGRSWRGVDRLKIPGLSFRAPDVRMVPVSDDAW